MVFSGRREWYSGRATPQHRPSTSLMRDVEEERRAIHASASVYELSHGDAAIPLTSRHPRHPGACESAPDAAPMETYPPFAPAPSALKSPSCRRGTPPELCQGAVSVSPLAYVSSGHHAEYGVWSIRYIHRSPSYGRHFDARAANWRFPRGGNGGSHGLLS